MILKTEKYQKSNQKSNFVKKILLVNAIFVFLFASCSNFIHELVPPQEKEIVFFGLKTENKESVRSVESKNEKNITLTVPSNTDVTNLIPVIRVSEGASVLPLTLPYLFSAFPSMDLLTLSVKLNEVFSSKSVENWVFNFIQQNPDFNVPELSLPIDFSDPVYFLVVSGQGNTELYKVAVQKEPSSNSSDEQNPKDNSDGGDDSKDYSSVEKDILSFLVNAQEGESLIKEKSVEFSISNEVDISKLYPVITVSQGASVLPLTQNYILSLNISFDKMLDFYSGYSTSKDIEEYCSDWLKNNDVELPKNLSLPIDFRESVVFAVVGSDKSVKLYTIKCNVLNNTPFIKTFAFTKDKNPGLMKDCFVQEKSEKNYFAQLVYPVDYSDFALVPELVYYGDKITCKIGENEEIELVSGVTQIPFTAANKTCTIMLYKAGKKIEYSLTVNQTFDPDTIRSITDFRFYKNNNKDIKSSVMASIYDEGDTGQITITVNYQDQIPEILIPTFYSPGTVSVNQVEQVSGTSSQNFSLPVQYLCVSKNKMFSRLYTVYVEFNKVEPATALINSFNFSAYLNKGISYDVQGVINDVNGTIDVEIPYSGESEPYSLTAQFAGTGTIYVDGIVQSSGYSVQNFSNNVYYKVVASDDESVSKQYVVRVSFKKDTDSLCEITSFKFLRSSQNPKLNEDVSALVVQRTKEIFVHLPFGSGSMDSLLTATFEAVGQVFVGEELQVSGFSKNDFSNVLTYKVVSANGKNSKEYTVTVQESGSVIYVNSLATGHNNGSSWQDAYITLDSALESIQNFGEQNSCEIWICDNGSEYKAQKLNNPLPVCGTISIKGGFSGNETSAGERDSSKKTKISSYCFDSKGSECLLSFENVKLSGIDSDSVIYMQDYRSNSQSILLNNVSFEKGVTFFISGINSKIDIIDSSFKNTDIFLDVKSFYIENSVFDSCNVEGSSKTTDFYESSFNEQKVTLLGDEQTVKNCTFSNLTEETAPILNFNSLITEMYNCNFEDFNGIIKFEYSTFISETDFSKKTLLSIGKKKNCEQNSKFEAKNCKFLSFSSVENIYDFKIIGRSEDEKCILNTDVVFRYDGTFRNPKIYIENVDCDYILETGYPCVYNYVDFEIRNSILKRINFSDCTLTGGIYNTSIKTNFYYNLYFRPSSFNIDSCNIENTDDMASIYCYGNHNSLTISNSTITSKNGFFFESEIDDGRIYINDSTIDTKYGFSFRNLSNEINLKNVNMNINDPRFFRLINGAVSKRMRLENCNFIAADNKSCEIIIFDRPSNSIKSDASLEILNSSFNFPISIYDFNTVKISNGSCFSSLSAFANYLYIDDSNIKFEIQNEINNNKDSENALYLSVLYSTRITNSNIYTKYGNSIYVVRGGAINIVNCNIKSEGKSCIQTNNFMTEDAKLFVKRSNMKMPPSDDCINFKGAVYISNTTFSDNNIKKQGRYHVNTKNIEFSDNNLIESPDTFFDITCNDGTISVTDPSIYLRVKGGADVKNSKIVYGNKISSAYDCEFYTSEISLPYGVRCKFFSPNNILNIDGHYSDCDFSNVSVNSKGKLRFYNCDFQSVILTTNKNNTHINECTFKKSSINFYYEENKIPTFLEMYNSSFEDCKILVKGKLENNVASPIICSFQECEFNNSPITKPYDTDIIYDLGSSCVGLDIN